jgi:hypothetical protein
MLDALSRIWKRIPAPARTVLNVSVAGGLAVVATAVLDAQGVTGVDWSATGETALNAVGVGIATAIFRFLNPLDDGYGPHRDPVE